MRAHVQLRICARGTTEIPLDQVESERQFFCKEAESLTLQLAEMAKLVVLCCFEKKDPFLVSSILSRSDLSS